MKLVIVESPTKARTIGGFLGKEFKVVSSYGHVRDLPKSSLGVDVENNFEPHYVIPRDKSKNITLIKKIAEKADKLILATDEDREGEAIAWHLIKALESKKIKLPKVERIVFHEITKPAVFKALERPRDIDTRLVDSQQARRILDRLVGYKLSPFLWQKVANRLSAGRVQSVALRFIVERENEIRNFKPEKYWTIEVKFRGFVAQLVCIGSKLIPEPGIKSKKETEEIVKDLKKSSFEVVKVSKKEYRKNPYPPFITSTLQQEASRRLGFSVKQIMRLAQNLYENGLITYMRTDSVELSEESLIAARNWIKEELGDDYLLEQPRRFKTKSRLAQEAHEAIRPTDPAKTPDKMDNLEKNEKKIYDLIWRRFIASQLPPAVFEKTSIDIKSEVDGKNYLLKGNGNVLKFDGFIKIWPQRYTETKLPLLKEGEIIEAEKVESVEHQTEPLPRYNEASLIKVLEENGIGRPSTYVPIISVIQERNYVEKDQNRRFYPTKIGELTNKVLMEHFPQIVDVEFTARMEEDLDEIAAGRKNWREVIKEFYDPFVENLNKKYEEVKKEDVIGKEKETNISCDKCGRPMVEKTSRFGRFLGCSGFPECRNIKPISEKLGQCPKCGNGDIVKKRTRTKRVFYGCSKYPECDFTSWTKPK